MRYSLDPPHFIVRLPRLRSYLLRHADTHRWYLCRDVLHCVPIGELVRKPRRFLAWWFDGRVR